MAGFSASGKSSKKSTAKSSTYSELVTPVTSNISHQICSTTAKVSPETSTNSHASQVFQKQIENCLSNWSKFPTKQLKDRSNFCREYIDYLGDCAYDKYVFADFDKIHDFIQNHRWKSKEVIMGHFSIILSEVCNAGRKNPFDPKIKENLKDLPQFFDLLNHKNKRTSSQKSSKIKMEDKHLEKLIIYHNENGHSLDVCSALLQVSTAARYDETQQFCSGETTFVASVCDCSESSVCKSAKESCFPSVNFAASKTGKLTKSIVPQFVGCYRYLKTSKTKLNRETYSKFLKEVVDPQITSHCLRSYLPNITIDSRKNISWKSDKVFGKHYCQNKVRVFDLFMLLNEMDFQS